MQTASPDGTPADPFGLSIDAIGSRASDENFPVAPGFLSRDQRRHLTAIYRFARLTDQIGDAATGDRLALLDELQRQLDRAVLDRSGSKRSTHPIVAGLIPTFVQLDLPITPFHQLIEANRRDQQQNRYATYTELLDYCALSANPVGQLVLHVFGVATAARQSSSDSVCTGLQLVEHWQDVAEDHAAGRIYLPAEDLARFGCRESDLGKITTSLPLRRLLRFETERARALLEAGAPLIRSLRGRARVAVCGFVAGGLATADAIEKCDYDVLSATPRPQRRDLLRHLLRLWIAPRDGPRTDTSDTSDTYPDTHSDTHSDTHYKTVEHS